MQNSYQTSDQKGTTISFDLLKAMKTLLSYCVRISHFYASTNILQQTQFSY